jgi:transposase
VNILTSFIIFGNIVIFAENFKIQNMLKIDIPASDVQLLRQERYHHPHPRVMLKMDVLYLKGLGYPNEDIIKITGVCDNTMRDYWKQYEEGGIERLKEVNFYRPSSDLNEYSGTIEKYFTDNPPTSISEAVVKIAELTGIKRGETQTRKFLKSLGFRHIKACSIPAKALTEEKKTSKEIFWKKTLNHV